MDLAREKRPPIETNAKVVGVTNFEKIERDFFKKGSGFVDRAVICVMLVQISRQRMGQRFRMKPSEFLDETENSHSCTLASIAQRQESHVNIRSNRNITE